MTTKIEAQFLDNSYRQREGMLDRLPNECPSCNTVISPRPPYWGMMNIKIGETGSGLLLFRCEAKNCSSGVFVAHYEAYKSSGNWYFLYKESETGYPKSFKGKEFSKLIAQTSPSFIEIYRQAEAAEAEKLTHISGVGYRKAFEFLVKDYLINTQKRERAVIEGKNLGLCIEQDIEKDHLKLPAKAATLVGNDETHYKRRWEGKDVENLKHYIELVTKGIEYQSAVEKVSDDLTQAGPKSE